ncbi:9295_t:CDS:2 [Funneliformis geosporum]|uniref:9295_t:CDS:1 n=1 Tax=Funneliformis geosporum TaxID=1117311 RepID=A0A9W4X4A3_9GLOM|nr:9295_t:CDS:2 [Funneliformis geosporum]
MDKIYDNEFYRQFQISKNRDPVWDSRDYSDPARTSPNLSNHGMGRSLYPVRILCQTEKDVTGLSSPNAETHEQKNHDDGNGQEESPNDNKYHVFSSKKDGHEKITKNKQGKAKRKKKAIPVKKDRESLHVLDFGPQRKTNIDRKNDIRQPLGDNELESRKNTIVALVSFECCPNKRRIQEFEPSLGELFRVGSLVVTSGTTWTTEEPTTPCHHVFPNHFLTQKIECNTPMYNVSEGNGPYESSNARNNSFMLVEKIKNEYDRNRIATSVYHNILSESKESDITDLTDDMESIQEFGFNHIIIVGERDYGMLFLDCYGRIFDWDHINFLLWPLGNYLEHKLHEHKNMAWSAGLNGTITEFEVGTYVM